MDTSGTMDDDEITVKESGLKMTALEGAKSETWEDASSTIISKGNKKMRVIGMINPVKLPGDLTDEERKST